jgi:hypothetical protein
MSETGLLPLLKAWSGKWRHAELWRIASESAPPDARVIFQSLLESISRPLDPREVLRRLLDEGSFSAAEALLGHAPFVDAIGDALIDAPGSDLSLDSRRFQARGEFLGALDVLLMRNARVGSPVAADDPRLEEALEWSSRDKRYADRLLDDLEKIVLHTELERVEILRTRLTDRLDRSGNDAPQSWRDVAERCLDRRQLDIAEALILGPYDHRVDAADIPLPRPLENARFANVPASLLCRWILGTEQGPSDFYARWDVLSIDASNRFLIETLERLSSRHPSEDDVTHLVEELEIRLNVKEAPSPVERFDNTYRTILRGLEDEACPVFADGAVSLLVAGNGAIADNATRGIRLAIVVHTSDKLQAPAGYPQLTSWDIVRCLVRPSDFRFNLLRILSSQLSRHRFIPKRDRSPHNWMESVRSVDARTVAVRSDSMPQLISGAVGIGKTSLLRSFLATFRSKGWTCRFISDASQLRPLSDPFNAGRTPGCALAIDNGHELPRATLERLLEKAASATGARLAVGGLPTLRGRAPHSPEDSHYRLPLVSLSSLRAFAERLFDLSGHPVSDVVLDRVAFYAAGRPALLYALVHALFLELGQRPVLSGVVISLDHVETAYGRSEFRNAAKSILLTPVEGEPLANLVLATVLVVMDLGIGKSGDPCVELDRIKEWLEVETIAVSASELMEAIEYLRGLELVNTDGSNLRVALSMTGGGYILLSLLPEDRLQHFSNVKARMS